MKKKAAVKAAPRKPTKPAKGVVRTPPSGPVVADLDTYRKNLEGLRDMLLNAVRKKKEEAIPEAEVGDEGDVAMRSLARDLVFEVTDNEHRLLEEVESALRRIEKGSYGICEANGEKISIARLKAIPYARYCINCQGRFERV